MGFTIWNAYLAIRDALDYPNRTNRKNPLTPYLRNHRKIQKKND